MCCIVPELLECLLDRDGEQPQGYKTSDNFFQEISQGTPSWSVSTFPMIWGRTIWSFPVSFWHSQALRRANKLQDKGWGHEHPFLQQYQNHWDVNWLLGNAQHLPPLRATDCQVSDSSIPPLPWVVRIRLPLPWPTGLLSSNLSFPGSEEKTSDCWVEKGVDVKQTQSAV